MFNGIVESIGVIRAINRTPDSIHFTVASHALFNDLNLGDSVAINGVCLTVTHLHKDSFSTTAVPETLRLTNLGVLVEGDHVNLERSLKVDSRISGHFVQGHIDGLGEVTDIEEDGDESLYVTICASPFITKYIVTKGCVALDGMSLTVVEVSHDYFTVALIPYTHQFTIAQHYAEGTKINIEVDIMGKYIEKLLKVH